MRRLAANHAAQSTPSSTPSLLNPREYQDEAERRALEHDGFCLFMQQRTGKTLVGSRLVEKRQPDRLFIACPGNAIQIWQDHLEKKGDRETVVLNLEAIWKQRKALKRWMHKAQRGYIIVDESHRAKDKDSKVSRALRTIARRAKYKLCLSGTPTDGKVEDVWAQMDIADPKVFGDWKTFKADHLLMGGWMNRQVVGVRNLEEYQRKLHSRSYRVLLEDVKETPTDIAPPNEIRFPLVESHDYYHQMHNKFVVELNKTVKVKELQADGSYKFVDKPKRIVAARVITQAMKLHQLTGGFIFDTPENEVHVLGNEKLTYCGALVEALAPAPVVIIVRFIPELLRIGALMRLLGRTPTYISGQHKSYRSGDPFDVAIVQIRSGISIDLAHAEECIFYSWNYSLIDYDQAMFRIRSFTSKRARYHYLIARGTIDEQLYQTVIDKLVFSQVIVDAFRHKK